MRRRLRKKTRCREFRTFGLFIEASLTDEDTATLLAEFRTRILDPYGLGFRGLGGFRGRRHMQVRAGRWYNPVLYP